MRYCLAKMQKKDGSVSSETTSEYKNIAEKYLKNKEKTKENLAKAYR